MRLPSRSPPSLSNISITRPQRQRWQLNFNTLTLLLTACISLCVLWSIHIHSLLHVHHQNATRSDNVVIGGVGVGVAKNNGLVGNHNTNGNERSDTHATMLRKWHAAQQNNHQNDKKSDSNGRSSANNQNKHQDGTNNNNNYQHDNLQKKLHQLNYTTNNIRIGHHKIHHFQQSNNHHQNKQSHPQHPQPQQRGLAACLLVNDENPRLPEWIAYHYHILPLRHLIVAVDPGSRRIKEMQEILERWTDTNSDADNDTAADAGNSNGRSGNGNGTSGNNAGLNNMGMDIKIWEENEYLPMYDGAGHKLKRGACDASDPKSDCLWRHRKRQRFFIKKCMADFKLRNLTWTLLIDVDEYIVFNRVQEDDPALPLDWAPEGMPILSNWKEKVSRFTDVKTHQLVSSVQIGGTLSGAPTSGFRGKNNGDSLKTCPIVTENEHDFFQGEHGARYGNIIKDDCGVQYYLRDDFAFRDSVFMESAPGGVPTLKDVQYVNETNTLIGTIYNGTYIGKEDGERIQVKTNWREPPVAIKTLYNGHLIHGTDRHSYFVERDQALWPPHLSSEELMSVRRRLPRVGEGTTVLDVLERESETFGDYAKETIGPCLSMPRLLYGSREDLDQPQMAPDGFDDKDFVTLRYRWHAIKEAHANKYQKTIVDVSRLEINNFKGEAENIHVPLKYFCRKDGPRYSTSFFRVNHYLDSFEAYSYRNDARSDKRQCRKCYDEKGQEADHSLDDDIRPWLKSFVVSVGSEKAKKLLAGAGNFVQLS